MRTIILIMIPQIVLGAYIALSNAELYDVYAVCGRAWPIDPARLREYTDVFGPDFIGLIGDQDHLKALTKRYRTTYGYSEPDEQGDYPGSHSSAVFAFDARGEVRLLMRDDDGVEAIAEDIEQLVRSG